MAVGRYWQISLIGRYVSGPWIGEMAQTSIRGTATDGGGFFEPVIFASWGTFNVNPAGEQEVTADFNISYGAIGDTAFSKASQKQAADAIKTMGTALKASNTSAFKWEEIRLSAFDAAGKVVNGATVFTYKTPEAGTATQMRSGPDRALVVSLHTGGRGGRARGRLYLPNAGEGPTVDGLIGSSTQTSASGAVKNAILALRAVDGWFPGVVSTTGGVWSSITSLRVGDEWDHQNRRREGRRETYTTYTL